MGVWLIRCKFGPFVGYLVAFNALVGWTPPDPDPDVGFLARRAAICCLASISYFCPGPGSSEDILRMAARASEKMVTVPRLWFLVAAAWSALVMAAYSASHASWPQPMWVL